MTLPRLKHTVIASLLSLLPLMLVSCGSESGRSPISGEVSFEGEPIDQGAIIFMPNDAESYKASGRIADGHYEIDALKGGALGSHKVLIFWEKKTGGTYIDRDSGDEYDKRAEGLPAIYQSAETPLRVEIVRGPNVHDFHLTGDK